MKIHKINGHSLSIDDAIAISRFKEKVSLSEDSLKRMEKSRHFVEKIAKEKRAVYGINTGFGPLSRTRISSKEHGLHQINLLHHLSVGQPPYFEDDETRSIMVARANALSRGYSGIRPEVVDLILKFLNEEVYPIIPMLGSVGASGDLVPLAHMARSLIGLGDVKYKNKIHPVNNIFELLNITPIILKEKEGLALVNGTSVMTGIAALNCYDASNILSVSEFISSLYVQVMYGEPEPFCSRVAFARGHRGQSMVAKRIADLLRINSSYREKIDNHKWGTYSKPYDKGEDIQDPYSVRCIPQILGAVQDSLWHIIQVTEQELNGTTDNPIIFPDEEMVIHCGNFYGQHISFVMDYLKNCMIKTGLLLERQIDRLLNEKYNLNMPAMLTAKKLGLNSGFMGCGLLATSLAAEMRMHAIPGSIQTIPTNANNQDLVSMGLHSAKSARLILPYIWKILAIESLIVVQAIDFRKNKDIRNGIFNDFYEEIREISPKLEDDRPLFKDIEKVSDYLKSKEFQKMFLKLREDSPFKIKI